MTTEKVATGVSASRGARALSRALHACDRILGEPGRRRHLFTWLRAPGGGPEDWLEVAAYYPSHRLVVVWHDRPTADDRVYSELVPAHGLRLLELGPGDVPADLEAAELALRRKIGALRAPPRPAAERRLESEERGVARAMSSFALHAETRTAGRRSPAERRSEHPVPAREGRPGRRRSARDPRAAQRLGMALGVLLIAALLIEMYGGVIRLGLDQGRVILALGFALDACARALGTIAAARSGATGWSWWSAVGGSPVVVGFAMSTSDETPKAEPAPLAGLIALLALAILALGALVAFG